MACIMVACVVLWAGESALHVPSHVVALGALACMVACGVIDKSDFRSGIAWESLVFIGCALGLANVFAYLGIDMWVVGVCQPLFTALAANPYLFVAGVGLVTVALRFVIVSEMAYLNIFMAFMVPLSLGLGISPWVVGVSVYALVNPWFALYQNPIYLAICIAGLMASIPYWQGLGLI